MTSDIKWLIGDSEVSGFLRRKHERSHAENHYLKSKERWITLSAPCGELIMAYVTACNEPERLRVLDVAAREYVTVVVRETENRKETENPKKWPVTARILYQNPNDRNRRILPRLMAVTKSGIFAGFDTSSRDRASHMVTAFRPAPGVTRGHPTMLEFRQVALRKLAAKVRESERLKRERPNRRRRKRRRR